MTKLITEQPLGLTAPAVRRFNVLCSPWRLVSGSTLGPCAAQVQTVCVPAGLNGGAGIHAGNQIWDKVKILIKYLFIRRSIDQKASFLGRLLTSRALLRMGLL